MTFNKAYFLCFLILLGFEVCIALFVKDGFIRHTFGDVLVVILVYCFIKSFVKTKPIYVAILVLIIAFCVEFLQLTNLLQWLRLGESKVAKLVLGNTFHFNDLIAYIVGITMVLIIEYKYMKNVIS